MSRLELEITFSPIMIDFNANTVHISTLFDVFRLQLMVSKLLEIIRLSNFEENNYSKLVSPVASTLLTVNVHEIPPVISSSLYLPPTSLLPFLRRRELAFLPLRELKKNVEKEPQLCRLVRKCLEEEKNSVALCEEGVGGTYFVQDGNGQSVAVFKPTDEEPGAVNNPKKPLQKLLLPPGGGAIREVLAYLLDKNRAGVPETHLLVGVQNERMSYRDGNIFPKTGSVQRFVPNLGNSTIMGSSRYSVENVHNIGILDIRLLNVDRNDENMLVVRKDFNGNSKMIDAKNSSEDNFLLVPIDHTYILPYHLDDIYFGWMYWRQSKIPFSQESRKFISEINVAEDAKLLRYFGISEKCIQNMKISSILLKKGVEAGLTLFQIASMICRKNKSEKSNLEILVDISENLVKKNFDEADPTKEKYRYDDDIEDLENMVIEWLKKKKNE